MKNLLILIVAIVVAVVVWKLLSKWLRGKQYHGAVVVSLSGIATALSFLLTVGILAPEPDTKTEAKVEAQAKNKAETMATASAAKPEVKPAAQPTPPPEKVAQQKTLGLSTAKLVGEIEIAKREDSPLRDGTRREILTINKIMTLEAIGEPHNLSRYTLVFGVPNDDNASLMLNAVTAAAMFANTYPEWNGKKDNAVNWFTSAMRKLTKNVQKNRDEPTPVKLERDGKTVELSAVPALGMIFLSVEPKE